MTSRIGQELSRAKPLSPATNGLPAHEGLRWIAKWLDIMDGLINELLQKAADSRGADVDFERLGTEVQADLRKWADEIEANDARLRSAGPSRNGG